MSNRGFYHNSRPVVSDCAELLHLENCPFCPIHLDNCERAEITKSAKQGINWSNWGVEMPINQTAQRVALAITAVLAIAASLAGCGQRSPIAAPTTPAESNQVREVAFDLYTHCVIIDLMAYGRYFKRVGGSLSDGSGNPPDGWGNPTQRGTLTVSGDTAIFRDKLGHVERFKAEKLPADSRGLCS